MTTPEAATPTTYQQEAGTFVSMMGDLASHLVLDYSVDSLQRLETFIVENFDPPGSRTVGDSLLVGIGCYVGEVIIRHLGGHWNVEGRPEINDIGPVVSVFPIEKARKRFENGPQDSLHWYYHTIARHVHIESQGQPIKPGESRENRGDGFLDILKRLLPFG